jgi:histone H3/H4
MTPRLNLCEDYSIKKVSSKIRSRYKKILTDSGKLEKEIKILNNKNRTNPDESLLEKIDKLRTKLHSLYEESDNIKEKHIDPAEEKRLELRDELKKQNSCFYFYPKFIRMLLDYLVHENLNFSFTFTDDAYLLLQFDLEYFLKKLLKNTIIATYHSKRETVMPKDIQLSKVAMAEYEKIIRKPRFVYPENNVSYREEYIKIRDIMNLEEKIVNQNLILQLDRFNHLLIYLLIEYAHVYSIMEKSSTITKNSLRIAVESIFSGDLALNALIEGNKLEKNSSKLSFNIKTSFKIEPDANIFLNKVIEYINAEIISLMDGLNSTLSFYSVLENDEELSYLKNHLDFVPIKMT